MVQAEAALVVQAEAALVVRVSEIDGGGRAAEGVPLTITPPLEKHHPDACVVREMGRKGMEPKVMARMQQGAAGLRWWNSATLLGALLTCSAYSQVFPSILYPSHLTRYCSLRRNIWLSRISSTTYSSSLSMSSGGGGGGAHRPTIGSVGASVSLTTLNTRWRRFINGGSVSQYAFIPTHLSTGNGPRRR